MLFQPVRDTLIIILLRASLMKACLVELNVDYPEDGSGTFDFGFIPKTRTAEACAEMCGSSDRCQSWTYVKNPSHSRFQLCVLKKQFQPNRKESDCCVSGTPCARKPKLACPEGYHEGGECTSAGQCCTATKTADCGEVCARVSCESDNGVYEKPFTCMIRDLRGSTNLPKCFKAVDMDYTNIMGTRRKLEAFRSAEECGQACGATTLCKSWTYVSDSGDSRYRDCYLGESIATTGEKSTCCNSGSPCPEVQGHQGPPSTVTLDKLAFLVGEEIKTSFTKQSTVKALGQIAIYAPNEVEAETAPVGSALWLYTCGSQNCTNETSSGSVTFGSSTDSDNAQTWPLGPGAYQIVLMSENSKIEARSKEFVVHPDHKNFRLQSAAKSRRRVALFLGGPNDPSAKDLSACWGECDSDSQCAAGLKCFQRSGLTPVPGCKGQGTKDWDYCYDPAGSIQLSGGNDGTAKNLKACTGECDNDAQCASGLKCFQRENGETIPGCTGSGGHKEWDYCYNPHWSAGTNANFGWQAQSPGLMSCGSRRLYHGQIGLIQCKLLCQRDPFCRSIFGALDSGDRSCWTCPEYSPRKARRLGDGEETDNKKSSLETDYKAIEFKRESRWAFRTFHGVKTCPEGYQDLNEKECTEVAASVITSGGVQIVKDNSASKGCTLPTRPTTEDAARPTWSENASRFQKTDTGLVCKLVIPTDGLVSFNHTHVQKALVEGSGSQQDGVRCADGDLTTFCVTSTRGNTQGYVEIEFKETLNVMRVWIANRGDSKTKKLGRFDVLVESEGMNNDMIWVYCVRRQEVNMKSQWNEVICDETIRGKRVKIMQSARSEADQFHISDVRVQGITDCTAKISSDHDCKGSGYLGGTNDGSATGLSACWGECDSDDQCAAGLKCFQRSGLTPVPGCKGQGTADWDYCYNPAGSIELSGGDDGTATNLKACTGECDNDAQCASGLKCFQRETGETIPGCTGSGGDKAWDYCYDPNWGQPGGGLDVASCYDPNWKPYKHYAKAYSCHDDSTWQGQTCDNTRSACLEDAKEACEKKKQCWGYAIRRNPANSAFIYKIYDARAVDELKCDGPDGLRPSPHWDTYHRIRKQISDVIVFDRPCWTYDYKNDIFKATNCNPGQLIFAEAMVEHFRQARSCYDPSMSPKDRERCMARQAWRQQVGEKTYGIFMRMHKTTITECPNMKALSSRRLDLEGLAEKIRAELAAQSVEEIPPPMASKERLSEKSSRRRLSSSSPAQQCREQAADTNTRACNALQEAAQKSVNLYQDQVALARDQQLATGVANENDRAAGILDGVSNFMPLFEKKKRNMKGFGEKGVDVLGFAGDTVNLVANEMDKEAQARFAEEEIQLLKREGDIQAMRDMSDMVQVCDQHSTHDLLCQMKEFEQTIDIHFNRVMRMSSQNHLRIMKELEQQNEVLERQSLTTTNILNSVKRTLAKVKLLQNLNNHEEDLKRIENTRTLYTHFINPLNQHDTLENIASSKVEWCHWMRAVGHRATLKSIFDWVTSDLFIETTRPHPNRRPDETGVLTKCELTKWMQEYTEAHRSLQVLLNFAASINSYYNNFKEESQLERYRVEIANTYTARIEQLKKLESSTATRCVNEHYTCPSGMQKTHGQGRVNHPRDKGIEPVTRKPCEKIDCTCRFGHGTAKDCVALEGGRCTSCNTGYKLENGKCRRSEPKCTNGVPEVQNTDGHDGKQHCASCNLGYHLEQRNDNLRSYKVCVKSQCYCKHGTGLEGVNCPKHNPSGQNGRENHCRKCNPGRRMASFEGTNGIETFCVKEQYGFMLYSQRNFHGQPFVVERFGHGSLGSLGTAFPSVLVFPGWCMTYEGQTSRGHYCNCGPAEETANIVIGFDNVPASFKNIKRHHCNQPEVKWFSPSGSTGKFWTNDSADKKAAIHLKSRVPSSLALKTPKAL